MPFETGFISGAYTATYNAVDIGPTQRGFALQFETHGQLINETDRWGDSVVDLVHRGATHYIICESRTYKAGSVTPFYPWSATLGVIAAAATPIGRLGSDVSLSLVLTSTANTPAVATPATLTGSRAILPPGSNLQILFTSELRNVPLRLLLLPTNTAGTVTAFSTT